MLRHLTFEPNDARTTIGSGQTIQFWDIPSVQLNSVRALFSSYSVHLTVVVDGIVEADDYPAYDWNFGYRHSDQTYFVPMFDEVSGRYGIVYQPRNQSASHVIVSVTNPTSADQTIYDIMLQFWGT